MGNSCRHCNISNSSNYFALKSKLSTKQSLSLIKFLKKESGNTAFVIMCYLNTIQKFGVNGFINEIKNIIDGIIIVDLPFEEIRQASLKITDELIEASRREASASSRMEH